MQCNKKYFGIVRNLPENVRGKLHRYVAEQVIDFTQRLWDIGQSYRFPFFSFLQKRNLQPYLPDMANCDIFSVSEVSIHCKW